MKQRKNILIIIGLIVVATLSIIYFNYTRKPSMEQFTFFNEEVDLHNEYSVKLINVNESDSVTVLNENDEYVRLNEENCLYISVTIMIKRKDLSPNNETHFLDSDDFKLSDNRGIEMENNINLNSLYDSRITLDKQVFNELVPIEDYSWLNKEIHLWGSEKITLCFKAGYSSHYTLMELKVDFFNDIDNKGTAIILAERPY